MMDWVQPRYLPSGVTAFCTTRQSGQGGGKGLSQPPFDAFNLSLWVGDDEKAVIANRQQLNSHCPSTVKFPKQMHGGVVVAADALQADISVADAVVSHQANQVCAIQVADCVPVLLFSSDGGCVGVAHAGWRGLVANIVENTIAAMRAIHPHQNMAAYVGPAISAKNYVVGDEVRQQLYRNEQDESAFMATDDGRWHVDLAWLARNRLYAAGVSAVELYSGCTFAESERFFSARRDKVTGRQAVVIFR